MPIVPVKYEQVVFCGLSDFQLSLYRLFISSPEIKRLLRGQESQPLKAINILKKLCNHPELLNLPDDLKGSEELIPEGYKGAGAARDSGRNVPVRCEWGGKFVVLERLIYDSFLLHGLKIFSSSDSYIRSIPKLMTRSCSSATIPRLLTYSKRCVGTRSKSLRTRPVYIANSTTDTDSPD